MAFGNPVGRSASAPMAEINIIPLVDVMLVLLVIFIITAPLLTHAVKIDLPQASSTPNENKAESVQLAVDAAGQLYWNGESIDHAALLSRLDAAGHQQPAPELHVHADRGTRYEVLAELMSAASRSGVTRIGFVTEPGKVGP